MVTFVLLLGLFLAPDGGARDSLSAAPLAGVSDGVQVAPPAPQGLPQAGLPTQRPSHVLSAMEAVDTDGAQLTIITEADPANGADFTFRSNIPSIRSASIIRTVAGDGTQGPDNTPATSARLNRPVDVVLDSNGNLFIADTNNHRIRKVDANTGLITTVAGDGTRGSGGDGGPATAAQFDSPTGVAVDNAGNLFIADSGNHRIRKVDGVTGVVTTVAGTGTAGFSGDDGPAISGRLNGPAGVAVDTKGNLFIADTSNDRIRKVDGDTDVITTVAGGGSFGGGLGDGGPATSGRLNGSQ